MLQNVLLVALFAFGISYAQAKLEGPLGISDNIRRWGEDKPDWLKNGVACPYCISFWCALVCAGLLAYLVPMPVAEFLVVWLAGYGLACFAFLYVGV